MKTKQQIETRLNELFVKYEQANFRVAPKIGTLINELEWILERKLTNFD